MDIILILYLIFIVAPIGTFIHELGHACGAKIVKADNIVMSIGLGTKKSTMSFKNMQLVIYPIYFIGGYVKSYRVKSYQMKEKVLISLLGPISSGVFAFIFFLIYTQIQNDYLLLFMLFNIWLAIINIIPFKVFGKQSDGFTILKEISVKLHRT